MRLNNSTNELRRSTPFIVATVLLCGYTLLILLAHPTYSIGKVGEGVRLFRDQRELVDIYFERSRFISSHTAPYAARQEYPLLGLAYLSIPRLVTHDTDTFQRVFIVQNLVVALIALACLSACARKLGRSPWVVMMMALPAAAYFTFNRFDIFPVALTLASILALLNGRFRTACVLLGVSFFVKWYPILFLPIVIAYWRNRVSVDVWKRQRLTIFLLIGGGSIALMAVMVAVWGVGSLFPFVYQMQRPIEYGTVFVTFVIELLRQLPSGTHGTVVQVWAQVLFLMQLFVPALFLFHPRLIQRYLRDDRDALRWMLIILLLFLLFSKVYSPQFILWVLPFWALVMRGRRGIYLGILVDLVHYFSFPLVYDTLGWMSVGYELLAFLRTVLLGVMLVMVWREGLQKVRSAEADLSVSP